MKIDYFSQFLKINKKCQIRNTNKEKVIYSINYQIKDIYKNVNLYPIAFANYQLEKSTPKNIKADTNTHKATIYYMVYLCLISHKNCILYFKM